METKFKNVESFILPKDNIVVKTGDLFRKHKIGHILEVHYVALYDEEDQLICRVPLNKEG